MNLSIVHYSLFLLLNLPFFVFAAPVVSLGPDTIACGSLELDAENEGATYLWNTGAITQKITVNTTGTYWVEVTDGTGSTRDSIFVEIAQNIPPPLINDTSFCGAGNHILNIQNGANLNLIYGSAVGEDLVGIGNPVVELPFQENQTLYIATSSSVQSHIGPEETLGATNSFLNGPRGAFFNAHRPLVIDSVDVYVETTSQLLVELKSASGEVLQSKTIMLESAGKHQVGLGFTVAPGGGYSLIGTPLTGRLSFVIPGATFPYSISGIMDVTQPTHPTLLTVAYYFFDWVISSAQCISDREMVNIDIATNPAVDLGTDRSNCGPVILDATNVNATYLWSTNETTSTINVPTSQTISVDVKIGNCVVSDTVDLQILEEPSAPIVNDKAICGPEDILFVNENPSPFTIWYDAANGGNAVGIGDTLATKLAHSTTLYVENANFTNALVGEVSPPENNTSFAGGKRGVIFDVYEPIIIEQVSVFTNVPLRLFVELQDAEGNVIHSLNRWIPRGEGKETIVPLNFKVLPGTDYQLLGDPQGTGQVAFIFPGANYPYDIPGVLSLTKSTNTLRPTDPYFTFYNWKVRYPQCKTERKALAYSVNIPLELGEAKYTCDQEILNTNLPNMIHLWSTNETTSSITVAEPGTYWVEINDGQGCVVRDSVDLNFPTPLDLGVDGVLCGRTIFSNYDPAASFLWNTNDTTPNLEITGGGTYSLTVVEPQGCELTDEIVITDFDDFPEVNLGEDETVCGTKILDAGNPSLRYEWSTGATTQTIEVSSSGAYSVTVFNENNCATTDTININTIQAPTPFFSYTVDGRNVFFNNLSSFGNYLWNFGDGGISLDISPQHTYLEDGVYEVKLIVSNNCASDTMIQFVEIKTVGINKNDWDGKVNIYPNPAQNVLKIDFEAGQKAGNINLHLTDLRGEVVRRETFSKGNASYSHAINIANLAAGIYILSLRQEDRFFYQKVVIR